VGGALTFDKVVNPIVYPSDSSIILEGLNHGQYLTINSTKCLVDGKNYSISSLGLTRIGCNIPIKEIPVGYNDVQIYVDHLNVSRFEGGFLVLPGKMKINKLTMLNSTFYLVEGEYFYTNGSQCNFQSSS
jgi:hypothetical protein